MVSSLLFPDKRIDISCGIGGNNFALRLLLPLPKLISEDAFRPCFALPVGGGPIQFPFFSGKKRIVTVLYIWEARMPLGYYTPPVKNEETMIEIKQRDKEEEETRKGTHVSVHPFRKKI